MDDADSDELRLEEMDQAWLLRHRSHDVPWLLRRWQAVARAARMKVQVIHETMGFPVLFLTSRKAGPRPLYFSAGVHGDEAGSVLGLLEWAERSVNFLRQAEVLLLPLFNPAGLALNTRADADGLDLNRMFDDSSHPHIAGWQEAMKPWRPRLAACLHEDYDAQGLYGYELNRRPGLRAAEALLAAAAGILPPDPRRSIDGRGARQGVIRRRRIPMRANLPEAVALYQNGTDCTLTFETPSEFSLAVRAKAHILLLQAVCRLDAERQTPRP